ncbi:glycosyltransferase family 4 protein [Puia sp.]|uniref:glycosyltransferase family 4 protein n=1 Tax=Puia sp. TaxID=2045100 RepID=UPI002F427328
MTKATLRLAIVTTHPIQYNAPWFRLLALDHRIEPMVFYTWSQAGKGDKYDPDFGRRIEWDIPLLDGYEHRFVENTASDAGSHHFSGIVNPGLVKEIEDWGADAILVFGWKFRSHLQCLRHFHGKIPVLFRGDSTLLDEQPGMRTSARRLLLRWVYRYIDYALYTGRNNRDYFSIHGLKNEQLIFAPHAIDNDRFGGDEQRYAADALAWRKQLGIGNDDLVLLFAGKLEAKKNPFFLVELAKAVTDRRLKIILVGNGVLEETVRSAAASDPRIVLLDFQNQQKMPIVYRLGDLFVLPSSGPEETWGLAVNEAMACGRPVMVSDRAGCAVDLVHTGDNGLLFDARDNRTAIDFLQKVIGDRGRLATMGKRSKAIIGDYSFRAIIDAIYSILKKTEKK